MKALSSRSQYWCRSCIEWVGVRRFLYALVPVYSVYWNFWWLLFLLRLQLLLLLRLCLLLDDFHNFVGLSTGISKHTDTHTHIHIPLTLSLDPCRLHWSTVVMVDYWLLTREQALLTSKCTLMSFDKRWGWWWWWCMNPPPLLLTLPYYSSYVDPPPSTSLPPPTPMPPQSPNSKLRLH